MSSGPSALRRFPNTAVGIPLGLGGQAILWKALYGWPLIVEAQDVCEGIHWVLFIACCATLGAFVVTYIVKAIYHADVCWKELGHPVRGNFVCGPCIALCMIGLAMPPSYKDAASLLQALWTTCFFYQSSAAFVLYYRMLYRQAAQEMASAPYLLSLVTWFLLAVLGGPSDIDQSAGMPLKAMCFGVGSFFSLFYYPFILAGIYAGRTEPGSPALFLMVAPISVAGIALIGLCGGVGPASEGMFGVALFLMVLLCRAGPSILARPAVLGTYWAYVFPNAALATLSVKIAGKHVTVLSETVAGLLVVVALVIFIAVLCRMSAHHLQVMRGVDTWSDPIVMAMEKARAAAAKPQDAPSNASSEESTLASGDGLEQGAGDAGHSILCNDTMPSDIHRRLQALEALVGKLSPGGLQPTTLGNTDGIELVRPPE